MSEGWAPPDPRAHPVPQPPYWPVPPPAPPAPWEGLSTEANWGTPPVRADGRFGRAPHDEPRSYQRLLRTRRWRPWHAPLGLLLLAVTWLLTTGAVILLALIVTELTGSDTDVFSNDDIASPLALLATNLLLAAGIAGALIAVVVGHLERPGCLLSVTGATRWRALRRFSLIALATTVLSLVLSLLLASGEELAPGAADRFTGTRIVLLLLIVVLTTPLQAAGEEFVFRGYLTQAISAYGRSPVIAPVAAALVSATLFALAHGTQDAWLFADRFAFGLAASYVAWRTGGLEAPIALHVMNNVVVLILAILTGQLSASLTATELDWRFFVVDVTSVIVFVLFAARSARKHGLATRSEPARVGPAPSREARALEAPPAHQLDSTPRPDRADDPWGMG